MVGSSNTFEESSGSSPSGSQSLVGQTSNSSSHNPSAPATTIATSGGTSASVFCALQSSSSLASTRTFGAPSAPAFGNSTSPESSPSPEAAAQNKKYPEEVKRPPIDSVKMDLRKMLQKKFKTAGFHMKIDALDSIIAFANKLPRYDEEEAAEILLERLQATPRVSCCSALSAEFVQGLIDYFLPPATTAAFGESSGSSSSWSQSLVARTRINITPFRRKQQPLEYSSHANMFEIMNRGIYAVGASSTPASGSSSTSASPAFSQSISAFGSSAIPSTFGAQGSPRSEDYQGGERGVLAGQSSSSTPIEMAEKTMRLISSDGEVYEMDEEIASQSGLLKTFLAHDDEEIMKRAEKHPVPCTGEILRLVIEYYQERGLFSSHVDLKTWEDNFVSCNETRMQAILIAADHLSFKVLFDLCCQTIADSIMACKTPMEIRSTFDIVSGFTPDEEEEVYLMNLWAFDDDDVVPVDIPRSSLGISLGGQKDHISEHIIEEILTRLTAKSVAMCRCVSRAWSSIISHPSFTASFSSRRRSHLLFVCNVDVVNRTYYGSICVSPLPRTPEILDSCLAVNHHRVLSHEVGHQTFTYVNGLLFDMQPSWCVIQNPSTGSLITVSVLEVVRGNAETQSYLGYDPVSKKFKILAMITDGGNGVSTNHCCLTLRGGEGLSWRSINCGIEHFPTKMKPVCINGHLFYSAAAKFDAPISLVMDFDVKAEEFSSISYFDIHTPAANNKHVLFDYNGRLASYVLVKYQVSFELWVLEDRVKQIWAKHVHVIPYLPPGFNGYGLDFVGLTHTHETVWLPSTAIVGPITDPLTGILFNIDTNTVKEISFSSSDELQRKRFGVSIGHTEYLRNPWEEYEAVAFLKSADDEDEGVKGNIYFIQEGEECPVIMSATIHGLKKASTYSIIVDGVILKTFTVDQSIPFSTEKIIDHNQISLAGQNSIFKKSAFILTDGEHAVAAGEIKLPLLGRTD